MTQTEFGAHIGLKGNTITGYESETHLPSDSVINNICKTFGVNEDWLRTGGGDDGMYIASSSTPMDDLFAQMGCTALEAKILSAYFALTVPEREAFCALLTKMFPEVSVPIEQQPEAEPPVSDEWTREQVKAEIERHWEAEKNTRTETAASFFGESGTKTGTG